MRIKIILMILFGMIGCAGRAFGQESVPDSVAVCPPGEPEEVAVAAPDDTVAPAVETTGPENASRLMTVEEIAVATDSITGNYDAEWSDLSMQGKLSFDGLPMSVSVKIYMKRGESVILSARAPFFGEVARVEANRDSITFINKHTRCYNAQSLQGYGVDPEAYLTDLQDVLLGQVAFPGHGRLNADNVLLSQWIALPASESLLYPGPELQTAGTEYGFVMDSADWQLKSFVLMLQKTGTVVETRYLYGDKGWTLGLEISLPKKQLPGAVQRAYPDYDGSPGEFPQLGGKYRKVDFRQLLKF
ncbi:MAG: DUF4292 domain-containing protein [Muribaculaceae bacterium]|nr:DUF4292 domain-containing protein [Muribaculaceae bacterium]